MMKLGRYIVGLLSGLTFGMLFAPKKGKQLRTELMKKSSSSGQEALVALARAFKDAGVDAASEMRKLSENEQVRAALNMSKEKMNDYLSQLEESGYDVAANAQEKFEEFSETASRAAASFKKRAVRKKKAVKRAVKKAAKSATKRPAKRTSPKASASRKTAASKPKPRRKATGKK